MRSKHHTLFIPATEVHLSSRTFIVFVSCMKRPFQQENVVAAFIGMHRSDSGGRAEFIDSRRVFVLPHSRAWLVLALVPQPPPHVSGSFVRQGRGSRRASRVPQGSSRLQGETPAGPGRPQSSLPPRAAGRPHVSTEGPGRCHHGSEGAIPANRPPLGLTPCHCHTGSSGSQPILLPRATRLRSWPPTAIFCAEQLF